MPDKVFVPKCQMSDYFWCSIKNEHVNIQGKNLLRVLQKSPFGDVR